MKKKSTPARRIRQPGNTSHIKLPPSTNKPQSHTYKKLKQTAVNFQQLRDNQEDDLSSSTSSSSTFSSSSQQHSSVDYEAEDENEDRQRQRRHKDENDSLIHVQNFLKCFGANAYAGATVRGTASTASTASMGTVNTPKAATTSNTELRNWRRTYRSTTTVAGNTTATATISSLQQSTAATTTTTTAATAQTQFTNCKPQKFQINTKFLRKPRNKLMKMLPTTTATATTTTTIQQQQIEQEQTQLFIDDSNAKFRDFSIDSLLNK